MAVKKKKNYREILYELQKEAVTNKTGVSNDALVKTAKQEASNQLRTTYKPSTTNTTLNRTKYTAGKVPGATKQDKSFLENAGYVGKKFGSGILGGISGLYEGVAYEAVNNIKKSEEEDKGFLGQLTDLFETTSYILNPTKGIKEGFSDFLSDSKETLKDKDASVLEKGIGLVNNATSAMVNSNPYKKMADEYVQTMTELVPGITSEKAMDFYQKPIKPVYELRDDLAEESQEYGKATQTIGDVADVVGRMVPSIATTMLTKDPSYGMAVMGLSTKGSSTTEALNRGAELDEAVKIGNTKAMIEVGAEMMTGGLNIFGKGALDDIVEAGIDKKVKNEVLNFLMQKGYGIAGEIGEETITDILNTALDKGTVDPNASYSIEDFGDTAVVTILSTLVLNALGGGYSPSAYKANAERISGQDVVNKVADKVDVVVSEDIQKQETTEETDEEALAKRNYYQYTPVDTDSEIARTVKESATKAMNDSKRSHEFVDTVVKIAEKTGTKYRFTNDAELKQLGHLVERTDLTESEQKQLLELKQQLNEAKTQQEYDEIQNKIDSITHYKTNGLVNENGEVLINIDSQNALNRIVGHETFHLVENEAEANKLREFAKKYAETKGDYQARLDRANRLYANTNANIDNEVTADIIGDYLFTDQQFINSLSTEQPNLFRRIYNEIKHWLRMATAGSKEARQLEQLQHSFEKAMNSKQASETTTDGDAKFSLIGEEADKTFGQKVNNTRAKVMKKLGQTDQAIWEKTGYQQNDTTGKWQTEVSDPKFKSKTKVEVGKEYRLDEVLDAEELFKAYPELRERTITRTDFIKMAETEEELNLAKKLKGATTEDGNILIGDFIESKRVAEEIVAHEVQHLIQTIEGLDYDHKAYFLQDENGKFYKSKEYVEEVAEKEARQVQNRHKMSEEERRNVVPKETSSKVDFKRYSLSDSGEMIDSEGNKVTLETSETGTTRNLMAIHNLNESKLKGVIELGGFPVPSIAITNPSKVNFATYGDISVLFDKNTIDPSDKANEVYGSDVYSPRFPETIQKVNEKELDKLNKYLGKNLYVEDTTLEDTKQKNRNNSDFINKFIEENNIKVNDVYKDADDNYGFSKDENMRKFVIENDITYEKLLNNKELRNQFYDMYRDFSPMVSFAERKIETWEKMFEQGTLENSIAGRLNSDFNAIKNGSEKVFDEYGTKQAKRNVVLNEYAEKYDKFLDEKLSPIFGDKYIRNNKELFTSSGNRRSFSQLYNEYTLSNIVKEMKGKVRGEEGFFYGAGNIRSQVTPQFKSIADIKANEHKLVTNSQMESVKQDIDSDLNNLSVTAKNFGGYSYDSYETALNEIASLKRITSTKARKILEDYGFENVPDILVDKSIEFLEKLKNAPTEYFEAKPQRAVGLDEIQAIVIPNNAGLTLKQQLLDNGLNIVEYDPNIEGDRQRVINQYDDLKFSLSEANEDIAPIGSYNVYGKDVKADVIPEENEAPISQDIVDNVGREHFRNLTDDDITPTEGTFTINDGEVPEAKGKRNIINEIRDNFNIKTTEARELYNKIADMEEPTVDDIYNELEKYREIKWQEQDDYVKSIQNDIRGTRLDISNVKGQIADYGNSYRMSLMGKGLILGNQGQAIDDFYQELNNSYPNVFPASITAEADQLNAIADFMYKDTTLEFKDTIDDASLMDLARGIKTDIGNNERFNHSQRHAHFLRQAIRDEDIIAPGAEPSIRTNITEEDYIKSLDNLTEDYAPYLEMRNEINASNANETAENVSLIDELNKLDENTAVEEKVAQNAQNKANKPTKKVTKQKGSTLNTLKYLFTNRNVEIDNYAKETGNKNIKFYADHVNNVYGEVSTNINNVQTDNYGKAVGKGITDIFNQARKAKLSEAFDDYLFHKSNVARHKQGKGSVIPLTESQKLVSEYEKAYPEMKSWAKEVNQYNRNNLYKQVEAGLYTPELAKKITEMYDFYVPFFEDIEKIYVENNTGEIGVRGTVKRAKGGADRNLLGFEDAMIRQTQSTITAIRKNQLYREIVDSSPEKVSLGIGDGDVNALYADDKGYYVTAYDGGTQISARVSEELYKGLENKLEKHVKDLEAKLGGLTKTLQTLGNFRRNLLTTWSPTFIITNPLKDLQDAPLNSKYATSWAKNYPKALKELTTGKGQHIQEFLNMYGQANLMGDYTTDSGVFDITKSAKIRKKLSRITQVNEVLEMVPRYAEYLASLEHGTSQMEALYNAREVTTNFGRGGVITKALNRNGFTFLNASVQGFDKLIRNFSGENGAKGIVNASLKAVTMGVVPALFNALMYDDDEEYQALPDYIKDNYYLIRTDEGKFIRIPKGRMLSIFGSAGRRTLELMQGETDAFEGFLQNAYSQVGVQNPLESNILAPLIQAYGSENGTTWYGTDIVPSRLQDVPEAEQSDETIDKFSIWLGEKIENSPIGKYVDASPYKINYVLDQYTGGIGDILLPLITEEGTSDAETIPEMMLAPLKDKFTANSTTDNKYVSDVYTLSDELYKKSNSAYATDEDKLVNQYIYSITSDMGELYAERRAVQNDDSLTKAEKYAKSQAIKDEINRLAKEGLDGYKNVNKTENYAIVGGREFNKYTANDGTERWGSVYEDVLDEMNALGMELEEKSEFFNAQSIIKDIQSNYDGSTDYNAKKRDVISVIKGTNLNDEQKAYLYDKYYASTETLKAVTTLGIDFDSYLDFESQEFEADVDRNGKTISGSKKKKVFDYINSMNIDFGQKLVLAKLQYNSYDEYNHELINYLNESDLTYEEEVELLKKMGFEVDDAGNIYW